MREIVTSRFGCSFAFGAFSAFPLFSVAARSPRS